MVIAGQVGCILETNPDFAPSTDGVAGSEGDSSAGVEGPSPAEGSTGSPALPDGCVLVDTFDGTTLESWWSAGGEGTAVVAEGLCRLRAPSGGDAKPQASVGPIPTTEITVSLGSFPTKAGQVLRIGVRGSASFFLTLEGGRLTAIKEEGGATHTYGIPSKGFERYRIVTEDRSLWWEGADAGDAFVRLAEFEVDSLEDLHVFEVEVEGRGSEETQVELDAIEVCSR